MVDIKKTLERYLNAPAGKVKAKQTRTDILIQNIYKNACEGDNKAVESILAILDREDVTEETDTPLTKAQNDRAKNKNNA